ncbi:MAG: HD domain-containing protein [Campylobacterales bacterium]|nr:HD domain-containing protein [Campylobacterales bacterium]
MKFNLNQFLLAVSDALDFVEITTLGATSFHSKRVAYISLELGKLYNFSDKEKFDLCSFSLLHDNGLSEENIVNEVENSNKPSTINILEQNPIHCNIGEKNIKGFPFLTNETNIVKYHHESYDGSGVFGLKKEEIPLMSQIIALADTVDNLFHFENPSLENRKEIIQFINDKEEIFYSKTLVEYFNALSKKTSFWLDLQSPNLEKMIIEKLPHFDIDIELKDLVDLSKVFTNIIDSNSTFTKTHSSGLSDKVQEMSAFYKFDFNKTMELLIAANLHDLGKLAVPNKILDKNGKLTLDEFETIKTHTYYTRQALTKIDGFERITNWASNHHEKLDGTGYPYGIDKESLCFESRLMSCLDIYQALTEDRPYREGMNHQKALEIMEDMVSKGFIDGKIVEDIDKVLV